MKHPSSSNESSPGQPEAQIPLDLNSDINGAFEISDAVKQSLLEAGVAPTVVETDGSSRNVTAELAETAASAYLDGILLIRRVDQRRQTRRRILGKIIGR